MLGFGFGETGSIRIAKGADPRLEFDRLAFGLGMIPATVTGEAELPGDYYLVPPLATLVTSMFLHGGLMHLLGNMLYLWVFGDNVEDAMGHLRFVAFYLLCAVSAAIIYTWTDPSSTVPTVGASGAISGVLGAYLLLFPHARVRTLVTLGFFIHITFLPAWVLLVVWIGFQILSHASQPLDPQAGGVAYAAHIGGFVAGLALILPFRKYRRRLYSRYT